MANPVFIRLAEVINKKQDMRVVSVTVKPTLTNCSGTIWFTDLMLQEGPALTGFDNPFKQAEYAYSLIESEVETNGGN